MAKGAYLALYPSLEVGPKIREAVIDHVLPLGANHFGKMASRVAYH